MFVLVKNSHPIDIPKAWNEAFLKRVFQRHGEDPELVQAPGLTKGHQLCVMPVLDKTERKSPAEYYHVGQESLLVKAGWVESVKPVNQYQQAFILPISKANKLKEVNAWADEQMQVITANYPETEQQSWPKQEMEAAAYLADNTAPAIMLRKIAAERGIEIADLVARVITKAKAFANLSGIVFGRRQALEDQIDLLPTAAQIDALPMPQAIESSTPT